MPLQAEYEINWLISIATPPPYALYMHVLYFFSAWKRFSMAAYLLPSLLFFFSASAQDNVGNSRPTLDRIPDQSTRFSTDLHFIEIKGITAGDESEQEVTVAVFTEDEDLIESISADLVGNGNGFINYRLKTGAAGTATVKVVITDNGELPSSVTRTFHITSEALNHDLPATPLLQAVSNQQLRAFPNPALRSTRVHFSTPINEKRMTLEMYTLSGAKIRQLYTGSTLARHSYYVDVNSNNLAGGVYIIRLIGQSHMANMKLIVAK